jgi:endonuclease/exonuclease/phosphatase family metal-dependent hydrolase
MRFAALIGRPAAVLAVALLSGLQAAGTSDPAAPAMRLCVATFNLRFASSEGPNAWSQRRPVMRECLTQLAPDLIGTQEGLYPQLNDIASDLPAYHWIGTGRDGGNKGEFMAIFYKRDRFEPVATNHFWLSDTPEVAASSSWGNTSRRMVTWVRFRERPTGREFLLWNTHFDNAVEAARQKSAELIKQRIEALHTELPLVLTGDFNCAGGNSRAYDILVRDAGFSDTWNLARSRANEELNSFHGFQAPKTNRTRIDWVLVRGNMVVEKAEIVSCSENGHYPSDHFPVAVWLSLP